jgi:hypothetical protein
VGCAILVVVIMVGENGLVGGELIVRVVIDFFFFLMIVLRLCLTKGIVESRFGS